jgi:glutamyl-tRNA reductase
MNDSKTHLLVLGLNHTTAPLEVRERLFIPEEAIAAVLDDLKARGACEAVVVSTCNRTEVYVTGADPEAAAGTMRAALADRFGAPPPSDYLYTFTDDEAFRHLFLVASGLDSMVIGEPQILGQVKDAHRAAASRDAAGPFLDKVFNRAFQVAKRVRTETRIGYNPVSISAMAVELARKIFGELAGRQILVVGAGEMCEIALRHFKKEGLEQVFVTNRTFARARQLAEELTGTAYPFDQIGDLLTKVDMVLASTGAEEPISPRRPSWRPCARERCAPSSSSTSPCRGTWIPL